MEPVTLLLIICVIIAIVGFTKEKPATKKLTGKPIPGPTGLKSLAAFIQGARYNNLHHMAMTWAEQYGDLMRISLGSQNVVFVNSAKLVRRLFNDPKYKEITNDRTPSFLAKYVFYGDKNVAFNPRTSHWIYRRKLFHRVLKFYGENVARFEAIFKKSIAVLSNQIENQGSVEITKEMSKATMSIVDVLLAGEQDTGVKRPLEVMEEFDRSFNDFFIFDNELVLQPLPFLRFMPGLKLKRGYDRLCKARDDLIDVYLHQHKKMSDCVAEQGVVDQLLAAQKEVNEKGQGVLVHDDVIKSVICETTIASFLTTSHTLNTLMLLFILRPEIQDNIYAEITRIIGSDPPCMRHRTLMPYTEACIIEVLRFSTNGPFLLPHYTREDIVIDDYLIPAKSVLIGNAWYCHKREDVWEDPWTFDPQRFLDEDGNLFQADHPRRQSLFSFGTGSRGCPGEAFARSRLFLIVSTLIQKFHFYALKDEPLPPVDPREWRPAAVLGPEKFRCGARLRLEL